MIWLHERSLDDERSMVLMILVVVVEEKEGEVDEQERDKKKDEVRSEIAPSSLLQRQMSPNEELSQGERERERGPVMVSIA